jgi:hypothetical protein
MLCLFLFPCSYTRSQSVRDNMWKSVAQSTFDSISKALYTKENKLVEARLDRMRSMPTPNAALVLPWEIDSRHRHPARPPKSQCMRVCTRSKRLRSARCGRTVGWWSADPSRTCTGPTRLWAGAIRSSTRARWRRTSASSRRASSWRWRATWSRSTGIGRGALRQRAAAGLSRCLPQRQHPLSFKQRSCPSSASRQRGLRPHPSRLPTCRRS